MIAITYSEPEFSTVLVVSALVFLPEYSMSVLVLCESALFPEG